MKFIKFLIVGLLSASMLSSCLGDSEEKRQGESFAYKGPAIGDDLQASLRLANGYKISDPQNKVSIGDCAIIGYTLVNPSPEINVAENMVVKEEEYYSSDEQARIKMEVPTNIGDIYPVDIVSDYRMPSEFMGDRWRFLINVKSAEGSEGLKEAYISFYYDANNQNIPQTIDEHGRPVGPLKAVDKNQVVIDVRISKDYVDESAPITSITDKGSQKKFVVDFSTFRQQLIFLDVIDKQVAVTQKYVDNWGYHVGIVFRFYKEVEIGDKVEIVEIYRGFLGGQNSSGNSTVFYSLAFAEESGLN